MAKFNGHQEYVILTALELYRDQLKANLIQLTKEEIDIINQVTKRF